MHMSQSKVRFCFLPVLPTKLEQRQDISQSNMGMETTILNDVDENFSKVFSWFEYVEVSICKQFFMYT